MYSTDHNEILHTSRQCYCRDVCKISLWSVEQILNYSTPNFDRISNSIEIPLVGQAPRYCVTTLRWMPRNFTIEKSTLVQVMAWCRQATSHYMSQCWSIFMSPYGMTRPQWVESLCTVSLALITSWLSGVAVACQRCRASDPGSLPGLASGR